MMRGILLIAAARLLIADASADGGKNDLEKFQGTWQLVSAEQDGKKAPDDAVRKIRLTITGNSFILRRDDKVLSQGKFKLDAARKPKAIYETLTAGPRKGKTYLAIYEIDAAQHKICFAAEGKQRPTTFAAPPGSGQLLQRWQRVKKPAGK